VVDKPILVAIDLGAESCRVSLLRWTGGAPEVRLVHRFANGPVTRGASVYWDLQKIVHGVEKGLRLCADVAGSQKIAAVAIDGWAVDYVRLHPNGIPIGDPFCYRDERTVEAAKRVHEIVPLERLYRLTGIQFLSLNTIYQLYADGMAGVDQGTPWVNLPEYLTHFLGGERVAEYTNATHTGLVDVATKQWSDEIFTALGLARAAAPPIVATGTRVGRLAGELAKLPAFRDTALIGPACHDTASAIAGIPAEGDDWAFISSGTWSLVGTVLDKPCATEEARQKNFTNLGGAGGKTCFLKNVNGMWIVRQCLDEWQAHGHRWTVEELVHECAELGEPDHLLDVDDPELLLVGNMTARINAQRARAAVAPLRGDRAGIVETTNVILHSLAARYAAILNDVAAITGKKIRRLYIVGGGSKNAVLNRLTAQRSGLEVVPGCAESTTVGNFAIQLAALEGDGAVGVRHESVSRWAAVLASTAPAFAVGKARRDTASLADTTKRGTGR
jgi:rhamnulokinase